MEKKITTYILVILMAILVSTPAFCSESEEVISFIDYEIEGHLVNDLFGLKVSELELLLGKDIRLDDGSLSIPYSHMFFPSYYDKDLGISFVFTNASDNGSLIYLMVSDEDVIPFSVDGVEFGMSFNEINQRLKNGKKQVGWIANEANSLYEYTYKNGGMKFVFSAYEDDNKPTVLYVTSCNEPSDVMRYESVKADGYYAEMIVDYYLRTKKSIIEGDKSKSISSFFEVDSTLIENEEGDIEHYTSSNIKWFVEEKTIENITMLDNSDYKIDVKATLKIDDNSRYTIRKVIFTEFTVKEDKESAVIINIDYNDETITISKIKR